MTKKNETKTNLGAILLDHSLVTPAAGRTNLVGAKGLEFRNYNSLYRQHLEEPQSVARFNLDQECRV